MQYRKFALPSTTQSESSTLRFIILATDGLWDELTNSEAVALVGAHLSGLRANHIARSHFPVQLPSPTSTEASSTIATNPKYRVFDPSPQAPRRGGSASRQQGHWSFVDENVSTHLIRNAFGGGDQLALRQVLSIPAPDARRYRDDVTVSVVWWENPKSGAVKAKL